MLTPVAASPLPVWRRWLVVLGVARPAERARLLAAGVGEALGPGTALGELAARVERVFERARLIVPCRKFGSLTLDLVARDGFAAGRPLGLQPREFALLWRLAETPGAEVRKAKLLREVWGLHHVPETNSLAVHAHRLRAKLARVGLEGALRTTSGGYAFAAPRSDSWFHGPDLDLSEDSFSDGY